MYYNRDMYNTLENILIHKHTYMGIGKRITYRQSNASTYVTLGLRCPYIAG